MARKSFSIPLAALGLSVAAGCTTASASDANSVDIDALKLALEDEYRAEAIYEAVIDEFGDARPFINIIQAERRHAEMAKAEMDRLGIEYSDDNPFRGTIEAPDTLLEACEAGVTAEIENIALYDDLLPTIEDPAVKETLTNLQWASRERHLPAFERCVARGGTMGRGPGRGGGWQRNN